MRESNPRLSIGNANVLPLYESGCRRVPGQGVEPQSLHPQCSVLPLDDLGENLTLGRGIEPLLIRWERIILPLEEPSYKEATELPVGESNPGLPRDRRTSYH